MIHHPSTVASIINSSSLHFFLKKGSMQTSQVFWTFLLPILSFYKTDQIQFSSQIASPLFSPAIQIVLPLEVTYISKLWFSFLFWLIFFSQSIFSFTLLWTFKQNSIGYALVNWFQSKWPGHIFMDSISK